MVALMFEGQKRCKIGCSDVLGTTWKNSLFKPWKNDRFFDCFSTRLSQKSGNLTYLKVTFLNSTRIELSLHKVILTP